MNVQGKAKRVRIYVGEGDKAGHRPAHLAILELLRKENAQGATVLRGVEGFGATGLLHTTLLVDIVHDLPLVIEWIDRPEVVERLMERVKSLVPHGLITVDETEIVHFEAHPVRDVSAVLTAADVMTREIATVSQATPLREVVELMLGRVYRALPVIEGGKPVGIITNGDLVRRGGLDVRVDLLPVLETGERDAVLEGLAPARSAADVMSSPPVTVTASTPLPIVAEAMARGRLKRLPVVDALGALVGIVSRVDLLRTAAGGFAADEPAAARGPGLLVEGPIGRVMRRDVPTVHPETPLPEVLQAVISTRLNRALVVDADRHVVGLVTDAELLERVTPSLRPGALRSIMRRLPYASAADRMAEKHARARTAAELMTTTVGSVREATPVHAAITTMLRGNHKVLAVVDEASRLVGIVDRADLLQGLVAGPRSRGPGGS